MKCLINTLTVAILCFFLFGCANSVVLNKVGEEQTPFQTVLVKVNDEDPDVVENIEYRTVREFRESGIKAFASTNFQYTDVDKDTLQVCLVLSSNETVKLFSISTGRNIWEGNVFIKEDFLTSSKEIARYLVDNNIVGKTTAVQEMEDKQAGAAIWTFSALLFLIVL